jgi:hypothetical protein
MSKETPVEIVKLYDGGTTSKELNAYLTDVLLNDKIQTFIKSLVMESTAFDRRKLKIELECYW